MKDLFLSFFNVRSFFLRFSGVDLLVFFGNFWYFFVRFGTFYYFLLLFGTLSFFRNGQIGSSFF